MCYEVNYSENMAENFQKWEYGQELLEMRVMANN